MQFLTRALLALAALVAATTHAAPAPAPATDSALDVWTPKIFTPNSQSVWPLGSKQTVTWDTSSQPGQVTNPSGSIFLRKDGLSDLDSPLASGFLLSDGAVNVQVPVDIVAGSYQVVLYGDSGDFSDLFSISSPQPSQ